MKIFILFAVALSSSLANEIFDIDRLNIKNLKFQLDQDFVSDFLEKYEKRGVGGITAIVNEYADKIFENIQTFAIKNHLDPLNLTDVEDDFLASSLTLTQGQLKGISTINRSEDVTISYDSSDKILEVYFPIVFSDLNFTYDYHVIILLIGPKGSMIGKIKDFTMDIRLQFDFNTYHAAVEEVKTTNKGHVSLTFHGNGIVDLVVNILSEFVSAILQPLVGLIVEAVVSDVTKLVVNTVNDAIDSILYPDPVTTAASFI